MRPQYIKVDDLPALTHGWRWLGHTPGAADANTEIVLQLIDPNDNVRGTKLTSKDEIGAAAQELLAEVNG